jgi:hypothetical protein
VFSKHNPKLEILGCDIVLVVVVVVAMIPWLAMIEEVDWSREQRREDKRGERRREKGGEERKEERRGVASHMCN